MDLTLGSWHRTQPMEWVSAIAVIQDHSTASSSLTSDRSSTQKIPTKLLPCFYLLGSGWVTHCKGCNKDLSYLRHSKHSLITVTMQTPKLAQTSRATVASLPTHHTLPAAFLTPGRWEGELLSMWEQLECRAPPGTDNEPVKALGLDTEDRPTGLTFQGVSGADSPARGELSRPPSDTCEEPDTQKWPRSQGGPCWISSLWTRNNWSGCECQGANLASVTTR